MKVPFNGWPFKTWNQGYVLGLLNGTMIGIVLMGILLFLGVIK
jgi:hypothetical protein